MRILALADQESAYLWDCFKPEKLEGIDLILSSGDLDPNYLSFLATFTKAPVLYVHGNHDAGYETNPPSGCICIEDSIYEYQGIRIVGLGGSMRYRNGPHQYTEQEMAWRVTKLRLHMLFSRGFDILLTHAPAYGLGDGDDLPHTGFRAFHSLLKRYEPAYFIHGHTHLNYGMKYQRCSTFGKTQIINAFERYEFEFSKENELVPISLP